MSIAAGLGWLLFAVQTLLIVGAWTSRHRDDPNPYAMSADWRRREFRSSLDTATSRKLP